MLYFAYGSNMDPDRLRDRQVFPTGKKAAVLKGYNLKFDKTATRNAREGYANLAVDPEGTVEGILYEKPGVEMRNLDRAEGVSSGDYFRGSVTVELEDGSKVEAVTYLASPMRVKSGLKPTREYKEHLLAGREFMSRKYVQKLEKVETLD